MKAVPKSKKPSFKGIGGGPINMRKDIAMGKQGPVGVTKRPGSHKTGGGLKIKTPH